MQTHPQDQRHHHYYHGHPAQTWVDANPERAEERRRIKRFILLACGAIGIMVASFLSVAAYEMVTSNEAKMVAQAARDNARSAALNMSTSAKCDRLISEAKVAGDPMPPCASRLGKAAADESSQIDVAAIFKAVIKIAAD